MTAAIEQLYRLFRDASGVSTDSRTIQPGALFFALKGPHYNGNAYASEAISKGALAAVIDEPQYQKDAERFFLVENTLEALQRLAAFHRRKMQIPLIAVAGSNGKTTTKELIASVLQTTFCTLATSGNLNNEIGVPLTLLKITPSTQIAVIEMGARQRGDIRLLCEIAGPTHGLITNTGKDHLETFKTVENTLKTNAELYEHLATVKGTGFINIADQDLMAASRILENSVTYGGSPQATYAGEILSSYPYLVFRYYSEQKETITVTTRITGKYNFENAMAAVAVGKHFSVSDAHIQEALQKYVPANNRSQLITLNSNTIILDAYNANPTSMQQALENFASIPSENKVAILGDMLELGEASYDEHLAMVKLIRSLGLQKVILVGEEFGKVKDHIQALHFKTSSEAAEWMKKQRFAHTTFLLKGSRRIGLEKILEYQTGG
ncbi:MAG: UDP-N-acetylmuramoyl-tripeptide--D-alanyl-D-alanine ligase [Chitinophagales bacterium]|nr:MAG: UDP-N-acetylmuramoyl-tripeptide--D-alanyl-D-alanine ligase [Chitinophagales bacterium]